MKRRDFACGLMAGALDALSTGVRAQPDSYIAKWSQMVKLSGARID